MFGHQVLEHEAGHPLVLAWTMFSLNYICRTQSTGGYTNMQENLLGHQVLDAQPPLRDVVKGAQLGGALGFSATRGLRVHVSYVTMRQVNSRSGHEGAK